MKRFQFSTALLFGLVSVIAPTIWAVNSLHHTVQYATSTRTIVGMDLPGNKRIRLVQVFNGEPWNTKLYFDAGDGRWGFYYYEHEDWYWDQAEVDVQGDVVGILRDRRLTIQLNVRTGECIVDRGDGRHSEYDEPIRFETDTRHPILAHLEIEAAREIQNH